MKQSGDRNIGTSGDRKKNFTAPPRLRGEVLSAVWKAIQTVRAALREIFDESAYDRFLVRTKAPRSVASYRDFMREREAATARRPRCC